MAAAGKKKSKKGVTLSLNEFNNLAGAGGDWADLEDDEEEHHAQSSEKSSSNDNYSRRDNSDRYNEDRGYERRPYNRDDGQERRTNDYGRNKIDAPQKPIPTRGPWMCFAGNLAFDVEENDLKEFFSEYCKVERVRLIVDHETGRTKGYGYVVFEDRESLVTALSANGESVKGRPMRVDVAEPQSDREPRQRRDYDAEPSRADSAEKWERGKALPQKEREYPRRDNDREGGYNRDREGGYNRGGYNREGGYNRDRPDRRDPPTERKPLVLKAPSNRSSDAVSQAPGSSKPSPFGEAKPRDETEYQKRVAQEKAEREKAAAEAAANKAVAGDEANASSPTTDNKPSEKRGNYNSEKKPYEKREYKPAEKREYNDRKLRDNQTERKPNSKYGSQEKDEKNWRERSGDRREQQNKGNYSYNTQSNTNKVKKEKKGPKFTTVAVKQQDKRVEVKNSFGSLSLNEDA